jgi:hypothetical protein
VVDGAVGIAVGVVVEFRVGLLSDLVRWLLCDSGFCGAGFSDGGGRVLSFLVIILTYQC